MDEKKKMLLIQEKMVLDSIKVIEDMINGNIYFMKDNQNLAQVLGDEDGNRKYERVVLDLNTALAGIKCAKHMLE